MFIAGLVLVFIGMAVMVLGPLLSIGLASGTSSSSSSVRVVGGGCVVIAFIPICFGYGMSWVAIMIIAAICVALAVALFLISRMMVRGVGFEPTQAYASGSLTRAGRS